MFRAASSSKSVPNVTRRRPLLYPTQSCAPSCALRSTQLTPHLRASVKRSHVPASRTFAYPPIPRTPPVCTRQYASRRAHVGTQKIPYSRRDLRHRGCFFKRHGQAISPRCEAAHRRRDRASISFRQASPPRPNSDEVLP